MRLPLSIFNSTVGINDWLLLSVIVTLLLMLAIMAPFRVSYKKAIKSMYRFNNPDSDVWYPLFPTIGFVSVFVLSCICIAFAVVLYSYDVTQEGTELIGSLLFFSLLFFAFFTAKLLLYTIFNRWLYNSQTIALKPVRWNCFIVMSYSVAGLMILVFSLIVIFLGLPGVLVFVFSGLMRILLIIGIIFKIKTSLFKNRRSNSGFILYLCAFEIAPVLIEVVILNNILGQI